MDIALFMINGYKTANGYNTIYSNITYLSWPVATGLVMYGNHYKFRIIFSIGPLWPVATGQLKYMKSLKIQEKARTFRPGKIWGNQCFFRHVFSILCNIRLFIYSLFPKARKNHFLPFNICLKLWFKKKSIMYVLLSIL